MTLAAVAARIRRGDIRWSGSGDTMPEWQQDVLVTMFEADPEFTLPARIEALAKEWDVVAGGHIDYRDIARRLRELVKP